MAIFRVSTARLAVIWLPFNEARTLRSCKSMMVQLYRVVPSARYRYVKSVHHLLFDSSTSKLWFSRLVNTLFACPFL